MLITCHKNLLTFLERAACQSLSRPLTALLPKLGYEKLSEIYEKINEEKISVREFVVKNSILTSEEFEYLISAEHVLALGEK